MAFFYIGTMWFVLAMLLFSDKFFLKQEPYRAGIRIPKQYWESECVIVVLHEHKKRRKIMMGILGLCACLLCVVNYASIQVFLLTVWLTILVIWDYFLTRRTIQEMYAVKKENGWLQKQEKKHIVMLDTKVSQLKNKMPVSSFFMVIPICIFISLILWWLLYGEGDKAGFVLIIMVLVGILIGFFLYYAIVRARLRVYSENSEINLCINKVSKRTWSGCIVWEVYVHTIYCVGMALYLHYAVGIGNGVFLAWNILMILFSIVPIFGAYGYVRSVKKELLQDESVFEQAEDEDEYWLKGYYENPFDRAYFVETRMGIGVCPNMAKPSMRWFMYGSLIFTLILCLGSAVFVGVLEFTEITIEVEDNAQTVTISGGIFSETLEAEEIVDVQYLTELPNMVRTWGSETEQFLLGEFRIKELGGADVFINRNSKTYLLIERETESYLLIGDEDEEDMQILYEYLLKYGIE